MAKARQDMVAAMKVIKPTNYSKLGEDLGKSKVRFRLVGRWPSFPRRRRPGYTWVGCP